MEERVMYLTKAEKKAHLKKDIENYMKLLFRKPGGTGDKPAVVPGCILCGKRYCCR